MTKMTTMADLARAREEKIAAAGTELPAASYPMNELAQALHPASQHLVIEEVIDHGPAAKSFVLAPDPSRGTRQLAPFQPGQYLSVRLRVGASYLTRPYAIRSTPKEAAAGHYVLTVKLVENGVATPYMWDHWQVGTPVTTSAPGGELFYEPLRDAKQLVAIAGGSGITPFYSMAAAILDGSLDADLTILYGSRRADQILLGEELATIAAKTPRVKLVNVLSEEERPGFAHGLIDAALIKRFAPAGDFSVFISGPTAMDRFVTKELAQLNLRPGRVRHELTGNTARPDQFEGYLLADADQTFSLTVHTRDQVVTIPARASESLLISLERGGIVAPAMCRSGVCSICRSQLVDGTVFIPAALDHRRAADADFGYVNPCMTYPTSDLTLAVPVPDYALEFE